MGVVLVLVSLGATVVTDWVTLFWIPIEKPGMLKATVVHTVPSAGPAAIRSSVVTVEYPETMLENETVPVRATYAVEYVPSEELKTMRKIFPEDWGAAESADAIVRISLDSAGFEVQPEGTRSLSPDTKLPAVLDWTVSPKQEGRHFLRLAIEQETLAVAAERERSVRLNGRPLTWDKPGSILMPVEVKSFWGSTRRTNNVIAGLVGFVGFVLTWPVLVAWLKRSMRLHTGGD